MIITGLKLRQCLGQLGRQELSEDFLSSKITVGQLQSARTEHRDADACQ